MVSIQSALDKNQGDLNPLMATCSIALAVNKQHNSNISSIYQYIEQQSLNWAISQRIFYHIAIDKTGPLMFSCDPSLEQAAL